MNGPTHKLGGLCTGVIITSFILMPPYNQDKILLSGVLIAGAGIGSLIPDIDHQGSTLGKKHKITSYAVSSLFGHRGITHAPLIHTAFYLLFLFLGNRIDGYPQLIYISALTGIYIGCLSHLLLDMLTTKGIPLLYPFTKKKFRLMKLTPSKNKKKDRSGKFKKSPTEIVVEFCIYFVTFLIVYLNMF